MNIWHSLRLTSQRYVCPIYPRPGEKPRFWHGSPEHKGPFRFAQDIITTDPRINPLMVYAPAAGQIVELVQSHTVYGDNPGYRDFLNYITVVTDVDEFYQICHIAANSCPFEVGATINEGYVIGETGANGHMTDVRHLHFMVGMYLPKSKRGFTSLRIRWQNAPI